MKLIMENWRRFTAESVITLDETQVQPKFLKEFVLSEGLLEEDNDPESLSLNELQKMPPKVVISAYEDMKRKETAERIKERIGRYKILNEKFQNLENEVFDLKHYGPPNILVGFFDIIKKMTNVVFGSSYETEKERVAKKEEDLAQAAKELKHIIIDAYSPLERELFRAISIFTGGNFPTIRNPDNFDPDKAKALKFVNDGIVDRFAPSKETYQKAKVILQKLVQSKIKPVPVWRGLSMSEKTKAGGWAGLDAYKKGATINVGNMSSFSIDKKVAQGFSDAEHESDQWRVILHIPKLSRGADVDEFSRFEGDEKEIIVSGNFKITKMEFYPEGNDNKKQEINSVAQALGTPNSPRSVDHVIFVTLEEIK